MWELDVAKLGRAPPGEETAHEGESEAFEALCNFLIFNWFASVGTLATIESVKRYASFSQNPNDETLHSGFHQAYKLHFPTNVTTTPPSTSTNERIHDCNPINNETHHHQTPLPPNATTIKKANTNAESNATTAETKVVIDQTSRLVLEQVDRQRRR
ncbi:hypothetical protein Tco_0693397 [Tanacetum coccineum]